MSFPLRLQSEKSFTITGYKFVFRFDATKGGRPLVPKDMDCMSVGSVNEYSTQNIFGLLRVALRFHTTVMILDI